VTSITGEQNEFSPVPQITFNVPVLTPLQTPESAPKSNRSVKAQTRALGKAHRAPLEDAG
jgi:hypothetical protein